MSNYINLFYSVYLHLFLLFVFLSVFFWMVISKTESKAINKEMTNSIKSGLKNFKIPKNYLTDEKSEYLMNLYNGKNMTVKRNNDQLFQMNITIIVIILVGLFSSIFVRYFICGKSFNVFEVITENAFILTIVGAIEYYFFTEIASKYVPVKPSYLPQVVKQKINSL